MTTPFVAPIVNGHIHLSLSLSASLLSSSSFAEGEDGEEWELCDAGFETIYLSRAQDVLQDVFQT